MENPTLSYTLSLKNAINQTQDTDLIYKYSDDDLLQVLSISCWNNSHPFSQGRFDTAIPFSNEEMGFLHEFAEYGNDALDSTLNYEDGGSAATAAGIAAGGVIGGAVAGTGAFALLRYLDSNNLDLRSALGQMKPSEWFTAQVSRGRQAADVLQELGQKVASTAGSKMPTDRIQTISEMFKKAGVNVKFAARSRVGGRTIMGKRIRGNPAPEETGYPWQGAEEEDTPVSAAILDALGLDEDATEEDILNRINGQYSEPLQGFDTEEKDRLHALLERERVQEYREQLDGISLPPGITPDMAANHLRYMELVAGNEGADLQIQMYQFMDRCASEANITEPALQGLYYSEELPEANPNSAKSQVKIYAEEKHIDEHQAFAELVAKDPTIMSRLRDEQN